MWPSIKRAKSQTKQATLSRKRRPHKTPCTAHNTTARVQSAGFNWESGISSGLSSTTRSPLVSSQGCRPANLVSDGLFRHIIAKAAKNVPPCPHNRNTSGRWQVPDKETGNILLPIYSGSGMPISPLPCGVKVIKASHPNLLTGERRVQAEVSE